ncbi:MAG TPA: hypothetical protein VFL80_01920 [Thermoanaerobaculia bacterium]|nr:hypothetical protein [Thermoanaerobaculia bacterium]
MKKLVFLRSSSENADLLATERGRAITARCVDGPLAFLESLKLVAR